MFNQEVYSIAILLQEEGLYHRCRIYATDMNEVVLRKPKLVFSTRIDARIYAALSQSRRQAVFSEYCTAAYDNAIFLLVP